MAVWDIKTLWGFMLVLEGAVGVGVAYPGHMCAVKGSTITLLCTFTPVESILLNGSNVTIEILRVRWCQHHPICQGDNQSVYDSSSQTNNPRYKYLGDKRRNCTLQVTDIQKEDEATFRFRMEANVIEGHFTEQSGVNVTVTNAISMTIRSSSGDRHMRGGENVTLYCTAACTFHQLEVTWFRDNLKLQESGPALQLSPLTAKDSGNYTCGLKINNLLSQPFSLHVEAEDEGGVGGGFSALALGVVFGVLLALFTLTMVIFIIRRKRVAVAGTDQSLVGGDLGQKHPQNICSHVLPDGGTHQQETSQTVDDVSYAAVQFSRANQTRPVEEAQEAIIYTSLANIR